ncbi:DNA-directed RNA polymerase subunit alpha [Candidatus Roizmanbacteria bacterium]|nr:DNA-directed RNA polymerase subunit alpha [Candidatus Roizmanbacteria bacterium]
MLGPSFYTQKQEESENFARFIFEPLLPSFGQTLGNTLRRTLLSSLPGAAITFVKTDGAPHLFTTLKGVKESVLDIVLNMKQLKFESVGERQSRIRLNAKGKGKIYGKDIEGEARVVNGDLYIAEITDDKGRLEIDAIVEVGYGYVPAEERGQKEHGFTAIDASFSPIKKVNYKVEEARVGRKTNFDRLIFELWTDGSISPEGALQHEAELLSKQFGHLFSQKKELQEGTTDITTEEKAEADDSRLNEIIIDELNLPSRVINALLRENIETVADLKKKGREKLVVLKGVGRKSIDLIEEELRKMGIALE